MSRWNFAWRETAARCALSVSLLSPGLVAGLIGGLALGLTAGSAAMAQNAPTERPRATITRTADTSLNLREDLTRNTFRSETRQVSYEETVPYQDTETYTEQVPYTASEPYQTTETYYENETVCRDVTRYDRQCRNEPVCRTEPGNRICRNEPICRTDGHGRQICRDNEVCSGSGGREVCRDNHVCRDIPRRDRECNTVSVPRTRTVTRYRDVTRYRTETRTRTVTRYRKETRCCRPETVQIFDRQLRIAVQLSFPTESQLAWNERETIELTFGGTESSPDVGINIQSSIFKYEIVNRRSAPGTFSADLRIVPMFTPEQLGSSTIQNLKLLPANNATGQEIVFVDNGIRPRVETRYHLTILEALSGRVVHQVQVKATESQTVNIGVPAQISKTLDYVLRLEVARAGLNLTAPVQFTSEMRHEFRRYTPEEVGPKSITKLVVGDSDQKFIAAFQDYGTNENIETVYRLSVVNQKTQETVHTADYDANEVTSNGNEVSIEIPKNAIAGDADHRVYVRVERKGVVLTAPVAFMIEGYLDAPDSVSAYKDPNRVIPRALRDKGEMVALLLQDNTNHTDAVKTRYDVELKLPNGKTLGRALLTREGMQTAGQPEMYVPLRVISVSRKDLEKHAASGNSLQVVIRVVRDGAKIGHIEFTRTATLIVP